MVNKQRIPNLKQAVSIFSLFSVFLLLGCNSNKTIVANVGDASLTDKDVFLLMKHYGYQPSDSIKYRAIVEDWCSNEIFNQELKKKHPEEWALIKLRSNSLSADLAKHYLEENDLRVKLDTIVTEQEIKDYYDSHQEEFILNDYIVKALYLKIPKNLDFKEKNVHRNYLLKNDKDLAELNSYAKLYAENYYFNDSTCNTSSHYSEVNSLCLEGEDKCCPKLLQEFSIEKNSKFDYCYQFNVANSSIRSIKYDCGMSKYQGMTTEETFSFIGLILLVLLVFLFFGCCIRKFCCGRNGYDSV